MLTTQKRPESGSLQNPQSANFRLSEVPDEIEVIPVNLTAEDGAPSKGLLYRLKGRRPKVGVHLMHPRTDQSQNYNILPLALAGYAVLGRASRWPNNDAATIHELLVLDVAAGIKMLRDQGCDSVILLGNSGGGSLATFYQAQSTTRPPGRLTQTPAGDPVDLNKFDLPPSQAIVIVGGHIGQGLLLGKMIDASVVDEGDPLSVDPELDMYDPRNGFRNPPESSKYSDEFLARYRTAQLERIRRLDAKARGLIRAQHEASELVAKVNGEGALHLQRAAKAGWHMIVYRTTADPAFTDLSIDPDDRAVFTYVGPQPHLENYGENGFARYLTPRAWLSTWSALSSRARTIDNLANIGEPLLIVHYAGDSGTRASEVREMLARSGSVDKQLYHVGKVDHYGFGILRDGTFGPRSTIGTDQVVSWMRERFPIS
jgi:hypothetical protein